MDCSIGGNLHGRKFRRLLEVSYKDIREKYDFSPVEVEILLYLQKNPENSASDLYKDLNLNKGLVSKGMDSLCKKEMLIASMDKKDRRCISYSMLPAGETAANECIEVQKTIFSKILEGISESEIDELKKICEKVYQNIEKIIN